MNLRSYSIEVVYVSNFFPLWEHPISKLLQDEALYKTKWRQNKTLAMAVVLNSPPTLFPLGWTSRQQFEETWAALLGVISSPPLPDTVSTEVCS